MQALCDQGCKKQFKVKNFKLTKIKNGVEKTGFSCPHCKHEYVSFYTDKEIRQLHKRGKHHEAALKMKELKQRMNANAT